MKIESFGDKKDVAKMLGMSVRSVDNYVANGMPHIKLSERRVRFDMESARKWFVERKNLEIKLKRKRY